MDSLYIMNYDPKWMLPDMYHYLYIGAITFNKGYLN